MPWTGPPETDENIRVCVMIMSRMCWVDGKHKGYLVKNIYPIILPVLNNNTKHVPVK